VVLAGSGGIASGSVMAGRYERIVIRSDVVVITSKGTALRSPLRSNVGRDVDTWSSVVPGRSLVVDTWSSVVPGRSLVVDVGYERMGTAPDAMTICEDQVKASASRMLPLRPDQRMPHWSRLLAGALYVASPRIDWPTLLRRSFAIDILACTKCGGRLRVLGQITEPSLVRLVLESLGLPADVPPVACARDPTDLHGENELA
jgi:hypothetical protein